MSEKLHQSHEIELPQKELAEKRKDLSEKYEKAAKNATHEHKKSLEKILDKVEKEASSTEEIKRHHLDKDTEKPTGPITIGSELRKHSLKSSLKKIQKNLNPVEKSFSKLVHNSSVYAVSEVTAKTLARPSGILFGGICSLVISCGLLFVSKYFGYEYNFLVGILAFIGGFFLGLLLESLSKILKKNHQ